MAMAWVWTGMVVISLIFGTVSGNLDAVANAALAGADSAIQLSLSMAGILCLWSGVMEVMNACQSSVATIIYDEVRTLATLKRECHCGTPPILGQALAFPRKHRHTTLGNSGCSVVLSREDVAAAPTHLSTQLNESLDEDCGLDCHVERAHNAHTLQRLLLAILATKSHQAGHLKFGSLNLLTSPLCERHIGHLILQCCVQKFFHFFVRLSCYNS